MNAQHLYEVTQDIETWRLNPTLDNDPYRVYQARPKNLLRTTRLKNGWKLFVETRFCEKKTIR